jgi:hypothetical protein
VYFLLKTPIGKNRRYGIYLMKIMQRVQYDMPLKTPLNPMGKRRRKRYGISKHLYLYCLIKNLYEKSLGKTHQGKKSTIYMI